MSKVVITIGCSGSGKSTYCNKNYPNYEILNMDDIRKELTGNISDQSKNEEVYKLFIKRFIGCVNTDRDCCVTNTNLGPVKALKEFAKRMKNDTDVTLLFFEDSKDWQLCLSRVSIDISSGVERSDTTGNRESGVPIIKEMSERYIQMREIPEEHYRKAFSRCNSVEIKYI